jgi:hypothetical protein
MSLVTLGWSSFLWIFISLFRTSEVQYSKIIFLEIFLMKNDFIYDFHGELLAIHAVPDEFDLPVTSFSQITLATLSYKLKVFWFPAH